MKGLARTKLAKSFNDAAFGEFSRRLRYKCLWNRKHCIQIDCFSSSSGLCNVRGAINDRLTLSDREWDCDCVTHHQRGFLAACNIRDEGSRMLAAGQAGGPQRSGRQCKSRSGMEADVPYRCQFLWRTNQPFPVYKLLFRGASY
ncbi:MAG: transposase [Planctomycetaceae bacterium]|nr:transposase [Planctomycetaceae bacterium]